MIIECHRESTDFIHIRRRDSGSEGGRADEGSRAVGAVPADEAVGGESRPGQGQGEVGGVRPLSLSEPVELET
jgi:hypothetical protein